MDPCRYFVGKTRRAITDGKIKGANLARNPNGL
jgi:hypothetical protein